MQPSIPLPRAWRHTSLPRTLDAPCRYQRSTLCVIVLGHYSTPSLGVGGPVQGTRLLHLA